MVSIQIFGISFTCSLLLISCHCRIDLISALVYQVKGPSGDQIYDVRDKTSDKFEFVVQKKGVHRFCFTNNSPYHETVDFDVHIGHFSYFDEHAKDGKNRAFDIECTKNCIKISYADLEFLQSI